MRVVFDANVFISALISSRGAPAKLLDAWLEGRFEMLISHAIVEEIARVMAYEHLQKYRRLREFRLEFVTLLSKQAILVEPAATISVVREDETDNRYIECAIAGDAKYIISGDAHLQAIGQYQGIQLLSPVEFLAQLESDML